MLRHGIYLSTENYLAFVSLDVLRQANLPFVKHFKKYVWREQVVLKSVYFIMNIVFAMSQNVSSMSHRSQRDLQHIHLREREFRSRHLRP